MAKKGFKSDSRAPVHKALSKVLGIYDLIGNLLFKKLIDLDLVHIVFGIDSTKALHRSLYPVILGIRRSSNEPGAYAGFDFLVSELTKKESQLKKDIELMLDRSRVKY